MDLGDAKYTVKLDDKATDKMNSIQGSMKSMGKQMAKVGAIMAAVAAGVTIAFGKMLKDWAAAGDEVAKMAKRTGWSTEALSEMRYAAQISGTSIDSLEKAVKRMSSTIEDAKDGLETYTRSFDKLGLTVEDVARMTPEEQFWAIANAIAELDDVTMQAALAQDFFGRAGTDMLPMLAAGAQGIAEMRKQAHDLGIVFDKEAAVSAEELTDATTDMDAAMNGLKFTIVDELAPVITSLINDHIVPAIQDFRVFIEENEALGQAFMQMANGIVAIVNGIIDLIGWLKKVDEAIPDELAPLLDFLTGRMGTKAGEQWRALWGTTVPEPAQLLPGIEEKYGALPEFQYGGVVPGPVGSAVPVIAHGGEQFLGAGKSGEVHVHVGTFIGNESAFREFSRLIKDAISQDVRRTSFQGVNTLGYFPGSSAP